MKKFFSLFLAVLLIFSCWTAATAESIDAVSGAPLDNDIEIVYKEHFDDMVTRYADELTEAELLVSADVYDAIGMIRFDSEDSLAARQRIYGIASADDLHAILIVHSKLLSKALMPWIIASQTIPILAIAPMIIVVLGAMGFTGLLPKALISTYLCFFPVTIGMVKGLMSPDVIHRDLMHTYNASAAETLWKLRLPASVPYLFTSLKIAIAIALTGAIVGELPTGAVAGIGARLLIGSYNGLTMMIWSALVAGSVMAATLVWLVGYAERRTLARMGVRA